MSVHASPAVLVRNTLFNLAGRVLPVITALAATPALIVSLGVERFGLLMLVWTVINYSIVFDMGLGRATTRFVAHYGGTPREDELPGFVWTSWLLTVALGVVGGMVLWALTPILTDSVFNIGDPLRGESRTAFYLLAAFLPVVLATTSVRGVLAAHQRFDLINAVQSPGGIANYLVPLGISVFTQHLGAVVLGLMLVRVVALSAFVVLSLRVMPSLRRPRKPKDFKPVLAFGGWLTVSGVVSPTMEYLDRLLIGALLTLSAVSYYSTAYTMVAQLHVATGSLMTVLFPAFSNLSGRDPKLTAQLYRRAIKYVFLLVTPIVVVFMLMARDVMTLWIDANFAEESYRAMTWLAFGMFVNALARVPYATIQAGGRPDITARLHLLEIGPFVAVSWVAIQTMGLSGAAIAWTARVVIDAVLLYSYADRMLGVDHKGFSLASRLVGLLLAVYGVAWGVSQTVSGVALRAVAVSTVLLVAAAAAWRWWMDEREKELLHRGRTTAVRFLKRLWPK